MKTIELPTGEVVEFPDSMSDGQISSILNKQFKKKSAPIDFGPEYSPTSGMSKTDLALSGAGKWAVDMGRGAQQRQAQAINALARAGNPLAIGAGFLTNSFGDANRLEEEEREKRKLDAPLMGTGMGKAGYVAAPTALGMSLGGPLLAPKTFGEAALSGPLYGLMQPSVGNMDMLRNIGFSTGGALLGQVPGALAQHAARPMNPSAEAQALLKEGIVPTPGQAADPSKLAGRLIRNFEERASSAPLIGEPIHAARERAVNELNQAAMRRTGDTSGQIGLEAVGNRAKEIGQQLDDIIAKIGNVQVKPDDVSNITSVSSRMMEPAHEAMLQRQLDMLKSGAVRGEDLAKLRTQWRSAAAQYSGGNNPSQRELGQSLKEAVSKLDEFINASAPPGVANAYRELLGQYRNLVPVEEAAAAAANRPNQAGVFTPQQLFQGVKKAAEGMKRKAMTQQRAPMQDLAMPGMVLRNTRPESGTTERAITAGLLGGGLLGSGYAADEGYDWRIPLAVGALSAGMYGARPATKYMVGGYGLQGPVAKMIHGILRPAGSIVGANLPVREEKKARKEKQ